MNIGRNGLQNVNLGSNWLTNNGAGVWLSLGSKGADEGLDDIECLFMEVVGWVTVEEANGTTLCLMDCS